MIEIMLPPPHGSITSLLYGNTPLSVSYDIIFSIVTVTILLLIDIGLRFVIELIDFNKAKGKECTFWNMFTALFLGWGSVVMPDGTRKRFLVSRSFRKSLFYKVSFEYPIFFTLAATVWSLPDVEIFGFRIDAMLSTFFTLIPMACEAVSIIEKMNEIDKDVFSWYGKLKSFVKDAKEVMKD